MSTLLAAAKASSEDLLGKFKALASRASGHSLEEIVQGVYELGVAYGTLAGKVECAKIFTKEPS